MPFVKVVAEFRNRPGTDSTRENGFTMEIIYPSVVVKNFFKRMEVLPAIEFFQKALSALKAADERVVEKYGFSCYGTIYYQEKLERMRSKIENDHLQVTITEISG